MNCVIQGYAGARVRQGRYGRAENFRFLPSKGVLPNRTFCVLEEMLVNVFNIMYSIV